jgi:hypothetical protein
MAPLALDTFGCLPPRHAGATRRGRPQRAARARTQGLTQARATTTGARARAGAHQTLVVKRITGGSNGYAAGSWMSMTKVPPW